MATQNHVTKRPITTGNAARKAGTMQADDAAKLAKKVEDQEAEQLAQAEQAGAVQEVSAMTVAQAEAAGAMAAEGSIGAVSAEAAAGAAAEAGAAGAAGAGTAGAAAGAAAVSPAVIGAAALGVVAVAAAASGGSSGGGSSSSNNGLATDKPGNNSNAGNNGNAGNGGNNSGDNGDATDKPTEPTKPAEGQKPTDQPKPADDPKPTEDPKPADQPKPGENSTPGEQPNPAEQPKLVEQPAEAKAADNGQPLIAESGDTKLGDVVAKLFEKAAGEGKTVEYIRIGHIVASEGQIEADNETGPRVFREVEVPAGKSAPTTKAETGTVVSDNDGQSGAAGAAKTTTVITAYEVVKTREPVTLEQAREMAQKMGGQLAVIDDADEAKFLAENLRGTMGHQSEGTGGVLNNSEAAWIASSKVAGTGVDAAKLDAMIRTGNNTQEDPIKVETIDFTGDKLSRFVVEYPDYKSPLTLDGKPVVDGQIINKDEFDKLVWDSSRSARGQITYEAVDSNDAKTAKPLEGAQKQTLTLTESSTVAHTMAPEKPVAPPAPPAPPAPAGEGGDTHKGEGTNKEEGNKGQGGETNQSVTKPVYPEGKNQAANVDHDKVDAELDKSLFIGTDPDKHPTFIKITGINETGDTKDESALYLRKVDASEIVTDTHYGDPKNDPFIVAYEDFDKLKWDSAQNTGGTFKFQALDANKQAIGDEQTVTISEKPAENPNKQEDPNKQQDPAQNQNQGNSGSGSEASGNQGQSGNASGQGGNASGQTGGTPGQSGNNQNQGGNTPGQNGQQTPNGPAASADKVGDYDTAPKTVNAKHDAADTALDKAIFAGKTDAQTPDAIKIVSVKASGAADEAPDGSLFKLDGTTKTPLKAGSVISKDDFDKLHWDATKGDGNHVIEFVPVKANESEITGAKPQKFTVQEEAATAPKIGDYPAEHEVINVANEAPSTPIKASVFAGNSDEQAPDAVQIVKVSGWDGENTASQALNYGTDKNLTAGTFLDKADFDKVQWNAAADGHVNGTSTFQFVPVTADHKPIQGAKVQTVKVSEAAATPVYPESHPAQHVETLDGDVTIKPNVFYGDDQNKFPMYVRLENLVENGKDAAAHNVLYIGDRNNSPEVIDTSDINDADGYILPLSKMSQLHWDAAHNTGGSFQFVALDGNKEVITGAAKQTVNVTEVTAPPAQAPADKLGVYPNEAQIAQAAHDKADVKLSKALFGGTSVENAPAAIKILHVKGSGDAEVENALYKKDGNDTTLLKAGDTIVQEDFDKLYWDASKYNGDHTIEFVPVKADKSEITDAPHHSFTVHEAEAPAVDKVGTYDESPKAITVEHNAEKAALESEFFSGKADAPNAPDFVKILHVTKAGEGASEAEVAALFKEGGTAVEKGTIIAKEDFGKLYWDARNSDDGQHTITFTPVKDKAGTAFDNPVEHSITVTEKPETPPAPIQAANSFGQGDTLKLGMMMGNQPGFSTKSVDTHTVISDSTNLLDDQLQHNLPLV